MFLKPSLALVLALAGGAVALTTLNTVAQEGASALLRPDSRRHDPGLGTGRPAPAWRNTSWLNTPDGRPLTLASLRGRVVLLNFWTFTCYNCRGALPSMVAFDREFRDAGLTVIGIHRPEFPPYGGEHDRKNVADALTRHEIRYANAQDNDHATWDLYNIQYWPSYVLIDRAGTIRWEGYGEFHLGDGNHRDVERRIRTLLAEPSPPGR
jgi:thiol-disulfide isomerase/thioredoxin